MQNQYWLYIDPYVHISIKKNAVLFYNTYNGKILEYNSSSEVFKLARQLKSPRNLRLILLKESDLELTPIKEFVDQIREHFMGDVIDVSYSDGKPIQMPPIVKNQKDVKYLKADKDRSVGEDLMYYLSEVSLYIDDSCNQNCSICAGAYRQFPCCTARKKGNRELDIEHLRTFLEEIKNSSLVRLNILGGDIFRHSNFEKILFLVESLPMDCIFYLHYLNAAENRNRLKILAFDNIRLNIPITFPVDEEKLNIALEAFADAELETDFAFIIQDEMDFQSAEALTMKYKIEKPYFIPFYNGNNLNLFAENIYIDREDFESNRVSLKDIYSRGAVNSLFFGRLTILPNGRVYGNLNAPSIGILGKHSIYEIIYKELALGKSWRKIRKNVMPCKRCTFEQLCPPISNYNLVIGKYNLCHILSLR